MLKENNKMQVDIENLFKQNVNDLSSIKELYSKLKEVEEKIIQVKYIDNTLVKKLKKEYEKLKKIILDENIQIKITNDIETINLHLDTKTNLNSSSVPFKICKNSKYIIDDNIYLYFGDEPTLTKNTFYTFKNGKIKLVKNCINDINNINYYVDSFCGDNDTQKIKTGLEFINYKGGGNLLFSAKRYWLDEEITISNDNVSLLGGVESGQKTIICPNYESNLNSMFVIDGQKMCIKDIVFSCNGLDSIYKTNGIFNRGYFTRIDNCTFDRCKTGLR